MKKIISLILACCLTVCLMSGCNNSKNEENDKLEIVTTIFPAYDWVKEVLGDKAADTELTMLLDNGVDLHSYQPTASDILKISECDIFVYVGGESDEWVEDALAEAKNKDIKVINLMKTLSSEVKEEELIEGMQVEEEEAEGEEEGPEYDEHVWLSLRNAEIVVKQISEVLSEVDEQNKEAYASNAAGYISKLKDLDMEYVNAVSAANNKTLLFGDRVPFRYFLDDYGINYYAAFVGCSAETEASFETIMFLANKVDELALSNIMIIDGSDARIAKTIVDNTANKNQNILVLDSMQSTTSKDVVEGKTYLSVMGNNLETLKVALM